MKEAKALRKLKKLTTRLTDRMEEMRDLMDDMEIEFEMLQKQITILESKSTPSSASKGDAQKDVEVLEMDDDEDEDMDLEYTSSVFVKPKFWLASTPILARTLMPVHRLSVDFGNVGIDHLNGALLGE